MATVKDRLHELVDGLPEGAPTIAAERVLSHLGNLADDPVLHVLMNAPVDDESESEEERAAVGEGMKALARNDVLTDEELRAELGL